MKSSNSGIDRSTGRFAEQTLPFTTRDDVFREVNKIAPTLMRGFSDVADLNSCKSGPGKLQARLVLAADCERIMACCGPTICSCGTLLFCTAYEKISFWRSRAPSWRAG